MIKKNLERSGYTAKIDGFCKDRLTMTIRNPFGVKVKETSYKNYTSAMRAWYYFCAKNIRKEAPITITCDAPSKESPIIEEPAQVAKVIGDTLPITAIVDFNFTNDLNLSISEWIEDINDRIKRAEFLPSDIVRIRLVPNT